MTRPGERRATTPVRGGHTMSDAMLQVLVMEFNKRHYAQAGKAAAEARKTAGKKPE